LNKGGKLENLKKEMQKNAVSVLSVSELRWKGQGEIRSDDYTVYYCGGDRAERGVAIVVHKGVVKCVVKKSVYSERLIVIKLQAEPVNILIVQVYMPTSDYENNEVEELYDMIEEILEEDGKGAINTIIMGEWNSVVGDKAHQNTVGPYGLGRRNQRRQMLIDFCERNGLVITNTWFKKPKIRFYTWKSISKSISIGLCTSETAIKEQREGCADNAWSRY
jgi:exonuclease III